MGRRGPQPSVADRVARGVADGDVVLTAEPGVPACEWPDESAEAEAWGDIVDGLREAGVLGVVSLADFAALDRAAVALGRARFWSDQVVEVMETGSPYVDTRSNGVLPHPAFREEARAWDTVAKAVAELGMSPTSRGSVSRPSGGAKRADDDALTKMMMSMKPEPVEG